MNCAILNKDQIDVLRKMAEYANKYIDDIETWSDASELSDESINIKLVKEIEPGESVYLISEDAMQLISDIYTMTNPYNIVAWYDDLPEVVCIDTSNAVGEGYGSFGFCEEIGVSAFLNWALDQKLDFKKKPNLKSFIDKKNGWAEEYYND